MRGVALTGQWMLGATGVTLCVGGGVHCYMVTPRLHYENVMCMRANERIGVTWTSVRSFALV